MQTASRTWIAALLALLLAGLVWFADRSPPVHLDPDTAGTRSNAKEERDSRAIATDLNTDRSDPDSAIGSQLGAHEGRRLSTTPSVHVVREDGSPIVGAVGSWIPYDRTWDGRVDPWPERDWDRLAGLASTGASDEAGRLSLDPLFSASPLGSLLWVTHDEHEAAALRIEAGAGLDSLPQRIVLGDGKPIRVLVQDLAGDPVPAARVRTVMELAPLTRRRLDPSDLCDALYLMREATTNAQGRATVPPLPGRQRVFARAGSLQSTQWRGDAPDEIVLTLHPTFTVRGRVVVDEPAGDASDAVIQVQATTGAGAEGLGRLRIDEYGTFGPLALPVLEVTSYDFQIQDGPWIPTVERIAPPTPGASVEVILHARRGYRFPVRVLDVQGEPVRQAEVQFIWQSGAEWDRVRIHADEGGTATLRGAPAGEIWIDVSAPAFVPHRAQFTIDRDYDTPAEIRLERAGIIRGRVTHAGAPVRAFQVLYWQGTVAQHALANFEDRKDGTFEIDTAPLGAVSLFAVAKDLPRGPTKAVVVSAGEPAVVALELPAARTARGRVVDGRSFEPVTGAALQVWVSEGMTRMLAWGVPGQPAADGTFELSGFPLGSVALEVSVRGYASEVATTMITEQGPNDFGVIALTPGGTLTVVLDLPPGADATTYTCAFAGNQYVAPQAFPDSGRLTFEGLAPGLCTVTVHDPEGATAWRSCILGATGHGEIVFRAGRTPDIQVEIVEAPGFHLAHPAFVLLKPNAGAANPASSIESFPLSAAGTARVGPVDAEEFVLEVQDAHAQEVGSVRLRRAEAMPCPVRIEVGGDGPRFRVLDRDRRALTGVEVRLHALSSGWARSALTDAAGEVRFGPWPLDLCDLELLRNDLGWSFVRGVRASQDAVELVFDPRAQVLLLVRDDGIPLPGVPVSLFYEQGGLVTVSTLRTEDSGLARSALLSAGEYGAWIDHPGLWPQKFRVPATEHPKLASPIQVRRLGSVVLHCSRQGMPVSGLALDIASVEFVDTVAQWAAENRVAMTPASGVTDDTGELRLDGLPRGQYRWAVTDDSGAVQGGLFTVLPGVRTDIDLAVP